MCRDYVTGTKVTTGDEGEVTPMTLHALVDEFVGYSELNGKRSQQREAPRHFTGLW